MEKYPSIHGVIFLENCLNPFDANIIENEPELIYADFGCINGNAQKIPCYKKEIIDPCYDVKSLNAITTDILYFRNNKYGKNMLTIWNNYENNKIDSRQSLSLIFNKYGFILFTRVLWFDPSYFCINSQKIFKKTYKCDCKLFFDTTIDSLKNKTDICDYFKQCGNKPKISNSTAKLVHYKGSKWK
jgi:hypothetical protein